MIDQQRPIAIGRDYITGVVPSEESRTTTSPLGYFIDAQEPEAVRQPVPRGCGSTASILLNYMERPIPAIESLASSSTTTVTAGRLFILATHHSASAERPRPLTRRNVALIALLDEWLADDSGYDESTWPELKKSIEESRTSTRKRFGE